VLEVAIGTQAMKRTVLAAVDAFNRGDVETSLASCAPDLVIHGLPDRCPPNLAGHRAFVADLRSAVPDVRVTVDSIVAEGDVVALRMTCTGTRAQLQGDVAS
jgi:predicted ester cyclase